MAKAKHFPDIEDRLRLFVVCVERGQVPPDWLLQFMADGAREFLRGGKPWQKGKGGRPKGDYGEAEIRQYLLHYYGGLKPARVAQALGLLSVDGKDVSRTVKRAIDRGQLAFCMAKIGQVELLKSLFADLLALDLADLTGEQRRKCAEGLRAGLADLELDDQEPIYT
jgi:hypothetical protein